MPGIYAHRRFGEEALTMLPRGRRDEDRQYRELFDLGLHGPDLLFYGLLSRGDREAEQLSLRLPGGLARTGRLLHYQNGLTFFRGFWRVLEDHDRAPLYRAYVDGCLCHFALDCICHGYVRHQGLLPHFEVETEFDRALLLEDGLDPLDYPVCGHLVPSVRNAVVTGAFYDGAAPRDVQRAIRAMSLFAGLIRTRSPVKRGLMLAGLRLTGRYRELRGLILPEEPDPASAETNRRLRQLYQLALPLAVKLILEYEDTMEGRSEPDAHYRRDFESRLTR